MAHAIGAYFRAEPCQRPETSYPSIPSNTYSILCLDLRKSTYHWCGRNTSWRKIDWSSGWEKRIGKDTFPYGSPWKPRPTSLKRQLLLLRVQPSPDPCLDPIPRFMTQALVRLSRSRRSTPRLTHRFNRAIQKGNEDPYGYRRHQ